MTLRSVARSILVVFLGLQPLGAVPAEGSTAGVAIAPTLLQLDEGDSASYDVTLLTEPTDVVTITVTLGAGLDGGPLSLDFTPSGGGSPWDTPQSVLVSAVENAIADGDRDAVVSHSASSLDPGYDGIAIADVTVQITDDDSVGVPLVESGGSTDVVEGGAGDNFTLALSSQPLSQVDIVISPDGQTTVDVPGVCFVATPNDLPGNGPFVPCSLWDAPATVVVDAVDDAIVEGPHTSLIGFTALSVGDPQYNGLPIGDLSVAVEDNDSALHGVTVTPTTADVDEGTLTTYEIVLDTEPSDDVQISLAHGDDLGVSPDPVVFTPSGGASPWDTPQAIEATALDDDIAEGDRAAPVTHTANSLDTNYDGIAIDDFVAQILEDDTIGLLVTETDGETVVTEGGGGDQVELSLTSRPLAQVNVTIAPDLQTTVDVPGVCFVATAADLPGGGGFAPCTVWNDPQTASIDAVNDDIREGPHTSNVAFDPVSAGDPGYDALSIPDLVVDVEDDDLPPNIVFILVDDLGSEYVGSLGIGTEPAPPTPTIDGLIATGKTFRSAWSNPVCTPTRAALHTGRHAFQTLLGATIPIGDSTDWLPLSETTLPELLKTEGYNTGAFGKWHLGLGDGSGIDPARPNLHGYDHFSGTEANLNLESYFSYTKIIDGVVSPETTYATTATTDWAISWISAAPTDEPWFAYVAYHAPHAPFHAPPAALHTQDLSDAGNPEVNPEPYYAAMVEAVDTEIGRLLAAVPEDAYVVFASDNGSPMKVARAPFGPKRSKTSTAQGGILVPFVVNGPGVTPGDVTAYVHFTDVLTSLSELAGVDPALLDPLDIISTSFAPYLRDELPNEPKQYNYTEVFRPLGPPPYDKARRAIVGPSGLKLIQYAGFLRGPNGDILIDLVADPLETFNLLSGTLSPEQQAAYDDLRAELLALTGFADPPVD